MKFGAIDRVGDIYCPQKRDLKGKPSRFICFDKKNNPETLLDDLNNIWIGSYKVRVFKPRFERHSVDERKEEKEKGHKVVNTTERRQTLQLPACGGHTVEGKSFADAVRGKPQPSRDLVLVKNESQEIGYQPVAQETDWLQFSFTGYVKTDYECEEIKEEINSESMRRLKVKSMEGNLVLIQSLNNSPVGTLLKELDE